MTYEQIVQLRDLLILYKKESHINDTDALSYFIDEIEKNDMGIDWDNLTSTKEILDSDPEGRTDE